MRNILLLVLGLAIIQASVMAKHYLVEAKDKTENGKGAPRLTSKGHDYKDDGPVKFKCKF